jgi:hypothetical protein
MGIRNSNPFFTALVATVAILTIIGLIAIQNTSTKKSQATRHPSLFDVASIVSTTTDPKVESTTKPAKSVATKVTPQQSFEDSVGVAPTTSAADPNSDQPSAEDESSPAPVATEMPLDPDDDLKSSATRLNMIDQVSNFADDLFTAPGQGESWSLNQQDMDQQDYRSKDGSAAITKWYGSENGDASSGVRAEEAQLENGQLVDRWYNENGSVQQVMHQYDKANSYSVYYYDNGNIEATRAIVNGAEIFIKYDRDGRQIQKTYTPASSD